MSACSTDWHISISGDCIHCMKESYEKELAKTRKRANELQERYNALLGRVEDAEKAMIEFTEMCKTLTYSEMVMCPKTMKYFSKYTDKDITNAEDDPRCGS